MKKVLKFKDFNQWVEKASSWLRQYDMKNIVCKDKKEKVRKKEGISRKLGMKMSFLQKYLSELF